jgi:hypothetical protein
LIHWSRIISQRGGGITGRSGGSGGDDNIGGGEVGGGKLKGEYSLRRSTISILSLPPMDLVKLLIMINLIDDLLGTSIRLSLTDGN